MKIEPTKPYVYQPDPVTSPNYPKIFALAGPGVPADLSKERFVRVEAEHRLKLLLEKKMDDDYLEFLEDIE